MVESYEIGQKLFADDFISDIYFPSAKYDYAEVIDVQENFCTLKYVDLNTETEEIINWTRAEMEEILGWAVDATENVFDADSMQSESEILDQPVLACIGNFELLSGKTPCIVESDVLGNPINCQTFSSLRSAKLAFSRLALNNG